MRNDKKSVKVKDKLLEKNREAFLNRVKLMGNSGLNGWRRIVTKRDRNTYYVGESKCERDVYVKYICEILRHDRFISSPLEKTSFSSSFSLVTGSLSDFVYQIHDLPI